MKRTSKELKGLKKKADTLFSRFIRARDKVCQKCKKTPASQCAHIFSRNNQTTRWDEKNAVGMCYYCHLMWGHREPAEFMEWIEKYLGKIELEKLRKRSKIITNILDINLDGIIEKYKKFK